MQLRFILLITFLKCSSLFAQIGINEFNSKKSFLDESEELVDWVEIYNYSNYTIDLANFYFSDNPNNLDKFRFPSFLVGPNELKVICASGKENIKVPNHWEAIVIPENNWKYFLGNNSPSENWNLPNFNDQSWTTANGGFGYGDNDDNTVVSPVSSIYMRKEFEIIDINDISQVILHADYDDGFIAYLNGEEVMRSNNFDNFRPEHDEFTNSTHEAVLYNGGIPEMIFFNTERVQELLNTGTNLLAIQVHNANTTSSDMSSNFFLSGGLISTSINYQPLPSWINPPEINIHADFKLSSLETIVISDSNENIIDSVLIPNDLTNQISKGRIPNGIGNWCYFNTPSPNISNDNNICFQGITGSPTIDYNSGWYDSPIELSVSTSPNTTSYYTTNGDIPDENDQLVNGPISLNNNSVLSVRSFDNNNQLITSNTVDRTYIFNETNHNLPVFSIISDENNLWDWDAGIYVSGPNATTEYPFFGSNFWEPWSKKSRMEYFDEFQNKQFQAEFDLEIHGGWSRAQPQKSFRIDTKSIYTGEINYPLIPEKPNLSEYNNFNLRNGGQHNWSDRIQDGLISRLATSTNIDRMGFQPCIVYLNGVYWGLYAIREKIDEHYVEINHGIDSKEVDLMNKDSALNGSSNHFLETVQIIDNANANDTNFINLINDRFDLDNYIDYFIFQTYIQNTDWLGISWGLNNVKLWRPDSSNGKWRYVLYDTDGGLGYFGGNIYENYINKARNPDYPNQHSKIFDKFLNNQDLKCQFTNRYNDLINSVFEESNFNIVTNELKNMISNAIPDHINRWGSQVTPSNYNEWDNAVGNIMNYNSNRISTARQHLNQSLSLEGEKQVFLDVFPSQSGTIQINSISPDLFPWDGVYHGGCPVEISAIASQGYLFSHWNNNSVTNGNIEQSNLFINLDANYEFIANFKTCESATQVEIKESENLVNTSISNDSTNIRFQWYLNENIISNDSVIYNPINGVYQLTISFDSCEVKSNLLIVENETYNLDVFPNPAKDQINIQFVISLEQDISISITNSIGKLVYKKTIDEFVGQYNEKLNTSEFSRDMYFIQLKTRDNVYTKKFIVTP